MRLQYILFLAVLSFTIVQSCQSNNPEETVDLINVVRDGATIPAYIYGNTGSKVFMILLHGGPGGNPFQYRGGRFTNDMEAEYAVVYTDQRGQGMAQGHLPDESFTPENMAADVHALALSLRAKYGDDISLFLYGHSWGGLLGSTVMVNPTYAQQYKGWIEVAGAHDMPLVYKGGVRKIDSIAQEQLLDNNDSDFWTTTRNTLASVDTTGSDSENFLETNQLAFEAEQILVTAGVVDDYETEFLLDQLENLYFINNSITSYFSGIYTNGKIFENGLEQYSLTTQLSNITKPTLLLWGKYDMVVTDEVGYQALQYIASEDKQLIIFERSGHSPMSNQPEDFTNAILDFIERLK